MIKKEILTLNTQQVGLFDLKIDHPANLTKVIQQIDRQRKTTQLFQERFTNTSVGGTIVNYGGIVVFVYHNWAAL